MGPFKKAAVLNEGATDVFAQVLHEANWGVTQLVHSWMFGQYTRGSLVQGICNSLGDRFFPAETLQELVNNGMPPNFGGGVPGCYGGCVDGDAFAKYLNAAVGGSGCASREDACACLVGVGACSYLSVALVCPTSCAGNGPWATCAQQSNSRSRRELYDTRGPEDGGSNWEGSAARALRTVLGVDPSLEGAEREMQRRLTATTSGPGDNDNARVFETSKAGATDWQLTYEHQAVADSSTNVPVDRTSVDLPSVISSFPTSKEAPLNLFTTSSTTVPPTTTTPPPASSNSDGGDTSSLTQVFSPHETLPEARGETSSASAALNARMRGLDDELIDVFEQALLDVANEEGSSSLLGQVSVRSAAEVLAQANPATFEQPLPTADWEQVLATFNAPLPPKSGNPALPRVSLTSSFHTEYMLPGCDPLLSTDATSEDVQAFLQEELRDNLNIETGLLDLEGFFPFASCLMRKAGSHQFKIPFFGADCAPIACKDAVLYTPRDPTATNAFVCDPVVGRFVFDGAGCKVMLGDLDLSEDDASSSDGTAQPSVTFAVWTNPLAAARTRRRSMESGRQLSATATTTTSPSALITDDTEIAYSVTLADGTTTREFTSAEVTPYLAHEKSIFTQGLVAQAKIKGCTVPEFTPGTAFAEVRAINGAWENRNFAENQMCVAARSCATTAAAGNSNVPRLLSTACAAQSASGSVCAFACDGGHLQGTTEDRSLVLGAGLDAGGANAYGSVNASNKTRLATVTRKCYDGNFYSIPAYESYANNRFYPTRSDTTMTDVTKIQANVFPLCAAGSGVKVTEVLTVKASLNFNLEEDWFAMFKSSSSSDTATVTTSSGEVVTTTRAPIVLVEGVTLPPPPEITREELEEKFVQSGDRAATPDEKEKAEILWSQLDTMAYAIRQSLGAGAIGNTDTLHLKTFTLNGVLQVRVDYYGRRRRLSLSEVSSSFPRLLSTATALKYDFEVKLTGDDAATKADAANTVLAEQEATAGGGASNATVTVSPLAELFESKFRAQFDAGHVDAVATRSERPSLILVEDPSWAVSPYAPCSNSCGKGRMSRDVTCYVPESALTDQCPPAARPSTSAECEDFTGCPFMWDCPLGPTFPLADCDLQFNAGAGITGLLCLLLTIYVYRGCRKPKKGAVRLDVGEGKKQEAAKGRWCTTTTPGRQKSFGTQRTQRRRWTLSKANPSSRGTKRKDSPG